MPDVSPTAYAILGLLAARPWSAYELAQHMKKSSNLRQLWPRAESKIYEAPKALQAAGWATSRKQKTGGRTRTVYRITAKGRRALSAWLDEPGEPLSMEFEGALKVAYATAGDIDQLRTNLRAIREGNRERATAVADGVRHIMAEGFTIPERAHTSALAANLVTRIRRSVYEWTLWAEEAIEDWDDVEFDSDKEAWARAEYEGWLRELERVLATGGLGSSS